MAARIIAQQGSGRFLIGIGVGPFQGKQFELGRVYDRPFRRLYDPLPVHSITARGYWEESVVNDAERDEILAEVKTLGA